MKYFKDLSNKVYAYESDGSQDEFIQSGLTPISEQEAMQIVAPPLTAAEMKPAALNRINAAYEAAVNALTAAYPAGEISSWPKQEAEARAWVANDGASTPWMDAAAAARGITKADLAARIISNADLFSAASGQLSGKRQKLRHQIAAFGDDVTQAQLDAIQW